MIESWVGTNIMPERFTETLRAASEHGWSRAVGHRFVKELFAGAVPDAVMARYLIQDHRFLDSFLTLLGAGLASADTFEARLRFGRFIGMVSGEENTYFLRGFEALGVTEVRRAADPDTQPTAGFKAIMREAALCCTDQQPGAVSPSQRHLREANVLRPAKLEHAVQRGGSNGHLGRLPASGP